MTTPHFPPVAVLGLGSMGSSLATALVRAGHPTTVWNRSADRIRPLVATGATAAPDVASAVAAAPVLVVCLKGHASVHQVLDPVADLLAGRTVVNTTTTTPEHARELSRWVTEHGAEYVDAGIMAVPPMIGQSSAMVLYSGSRTGVEQHAAALDAWGQRVYVGPDPGAASLYDLAILAGMYTMFAGFFHGVAMVRTAGVTAVDFAAHAAPFLSAMTDSLGEFATEIDRDDFSAPGEQTVEFNDLGDLVQASRDAGIDSVVVDAVQGLIRRQIDAGHGSDGFARIVDSFIDTRRAAA